jgi:hypothetical protein
MSYIYGAPSKARNFNVVYIQGGSNMTGTDLCVNKLQQSRSYLNHLVYVYVYVYTWSVRKVSDRIFLSEHLMDYNLARLHEPTLNLSAHA